MKWLSYLHEIERQRDFWQERATLLEARLDELRLRTDERLDRARLREEDIFDKALRRHGATPVRREEPPDIPPPVPSAEESAFRSDWIAEYLEVFPQASIYEAGQYFDAWRDGRYDPKSDPRVPLN